MITKNCSDWDFNDIFEWGNVGGPHLYAFEAYFYLAHPLCIPLARWRFERTGLQSAPMLCSGNISVFVNVFT